MKKDTTKRTKRGQNEGSVYLGSDGRWRAVVPAKYTGTGKRLMIVGSERRGTNNRTAVAERLREAMALGQRGAAIVPDRDTVAAWLEQWLVMIADTVRPNTLDSYTHAVRSMIVPHIGNVKLQALQPEHVESMLLRIRAKKYALRSVAYARSVLRIALRKALQRGRVASNVVLLVDPPKMQRKEVSVLNEGECSRLLVAIAGTPHEALITTILAFGLRIGEALGLQWRDVDFDDGTIVIMRGYAKRKNAAGEYEHTFPEVKTLRSKRRITMPESLATMLREHRRRQGEARLRVGERWQDFGLVFSTALGTPLHGRNALRSLHGSLKKAGLPQCGLHRLRHSAATFLLKSGEPIDVVSEILGHSSIRVTADVYRGYVKERQHGAAEAMDGLITGAKGVQPG